MERQATASIEAHFGALKDPRIDRSKRHKLLDIIAIAICAVVCGADGWVAVETFGKAQQDWFEQFLELPNGIPSHDTFGRVFRLLDPEQFQSCFRRWISAVSECTRGQVIAFDGKVLRRSHDQYLGKKAISMVSAWATANQLVLGQRKVDDKSNEITAIPELLRGLAISGCIITIDAMGCQKEIAAEIVGQGADYVLALKENQGHLHEDVKLLFDDLEESKYTAYKYDAVQTVNKGHGRIETRQCWTISDPDILCHLRGVPDWEKLQAVVRVRAERRIGAEKTMDDRYYISSLTGSARKVLRATRSHWGIENSLHWVLDIAFREDESHIRKDYSAQNFAILRHIALNLLKQEKTAKVGIQTKRLRAGWDEAYRLKVLSGLFK